MRSDRVRQGEYTMLLEQYRELKDDLLEHTEEFHDGMLFDIQGYEAEEWDYSLLESLRTQVKAFRKILSGLEEIKYVFG